MGICLHWSCWADPSSQSKRKTWSHGLSQCPKRPVSRISPSKTLNPHQPPQQRLLMQVGPSRGFSGKTFPHTQFCLKLKKKKCNEHIWFSWNKIKGECRVGSLGPSVPSKHKAQGCIPVTWPHRILFLPLGSLMAHLWDAHSGKSNVVTIRLASHQSHVNWSLAHLSSD